MSYTDKIIWATVIKKTVNRYISLLGDNAVAKDALDSTREFVELISMSPEKVTKNIDRILELGKKIYIVFAALKVAEIFRKHIICLMKDRSQADNIMSYLSEYYQKEGYRLVYNNQCLCS